MMLARLAHFCRKQLIVPSCSKLTLLSIRPAADGGARLIGDYETEQLCARMTLGELQGLCVGLYADGIGREQMTALLQVRGATVPQYSLSPDYSVCWLAYTERVHAWSVRRSATAHAVAIAQRLSRSSSASILCCCLEER